MAKGEIQEVEDISKEAENEIWIGEKVFKSSKITADDEGDYVEIHYLPHTRYVVEIIK